MVSQRRGRTATSPIRAPGMYRASAHRVDDSAVGAVNRAFTDELGWMFTPSKVREYGIDGHAEVVTGDGLVTGRMLATQVKGGASRFRRAAADGSGWLFWSDNQHLHYWLGYHVPVLVLLVRPGDSAVFWQVIRPSTVTEHARGFSMVIPSSQRLDASAGEQLLQIAVNERGLLESFPAHCAVLPPSAVRALKRAWDADPLPAARLAENLAVGRTRPALTVRALWTTPPSWLADTAGAQDLWLAVGRYAYEHDCDPEAAEALALAAGTPGPRATRAHAIAALAFLSSDRTRVRAHLEQARNGGEVLLADIGLAELAVPEGEQRAPEVPASVQAAAPDQLAVEPMVLGFLARRAIRQGDYLSAVHYRERQWAASRETDTAVRLALAGAILMQTLSDPDIVGRELQRVRSHAMASVDERRRWDGPSDLALGFVLDSLNAARDWAAVLHHALPPGRGGQALPREAASPAVAARAVVAAEACGDDDALEFFLQALPDSSYRRRFRLEADTRGSAASRGVQAEAWLQLLEESPDNPSALTSVLVLAQLGRWPVQADELLARNVLPPEFSAMVRAVHLARSGNRAEGLTRLRDIATRSALAALQLVALVEQDLGTEEAIAECRRQRERWRHHDHLSQAHVTLLQRAGRGDEAASLAESLISDQATPVGDRMRMCIWLVARKAAVGDFAGAERAARDGLAIGVSTPLAWALIRVLRAAGRIGAAREALARHRPVPGSDEEALLWFWLHLGVPLAADDARVLLDLNARYPVTLPRDLVLPVLQREAVLADSVGEPYPPDVLTAIAGLAPGHAPGEETLSRAGATRRAAPPAASAAHVNELWRTMVSFQESRAALADIAAATDDIPYGVVLLNIADMLPAADLSPALRAAGEAAAATALDSGRCVADLSAVHTLQLLPNQVQAAAREQLPGLTVSRAAAEDAFLTRNHVRSLNASHFTASSRPDGPLQPAAIDPTRLSLLTRQAQHLEAVACDLACPAPAARNTAAADAGIAAASELGLPLWCDDNVLRQRARGRGVPSFSVLDLATVLRRRGADIGTEDELARHLAAQRVVDMPLTGCALIALAADHDWKPGPAHLALERPAWWAIHDSDWGPPWHDLAAAASAHSPAALVLITRAAIIGATLHAPSSRHTQRYQELASTAIVACHTAGQPVPPRFLTALAAGEPGRLMPRPEHVRAAVATQLRNRGIPYPEAVAVTLLPGASLK
jgi:Domain of unknown function (DUF4365)